MAFRARPLSGLPWWSAVFALVVAAAPAPAQIKQSPPPPPSSIQKLDPNVARMVTLNRPDLLIESVTVNDLTTVPFVTQATVVVRNSGAADAVFPVGSALVRGDGTVPFLPLTTPTEFTIPVGKTSELSVRVADICAKLPTGTVTFTVDPTGLVAEANESNNARAVASVGSFAKGDLQPMQMVIRSQYGDPNVILPNEVGRLDVYARNTSAAPLLLCPGAVLFKETTSPLASTKGLRELRYSATAPKLLKPDEDIIFSLANALMPGDLPPGTYAWKVLVNPSGDIRETSAANNALGAQVTVK